MQIEFRFWNKKLHNFQYNLFLDNSHVFDIYNDHGGMFSSSLIKEDVTKDVIIQQYTGFNDKNDQKIYEGDILSLKEGNYSPYSDHIQGKRVVKRYERDNALHLFGFNKDGAVQDHPASGYQLSSTTKNRFTVIGNIYE